MSRTNIVIDVELLRKAADLTRLKTKRQIVRRALAPLIEAEELNRFSSTLAAAS
jgi:Arc/MetJ family transcription regulator